jgi:hypothetical protein
MATARKGRAKTGKRKAGGKVGDLAAKQVRGPGVKGGASAPRYTAPPDPDNVMNTLTKTSKTYLGG